MKETRPYLLTVLLHPQTTSREVEAVETLVRTWVEGHEGNVQNVQHQEKRRIAYEISHTQQVSQTTVAFELPATPLEDLQNKLKRQKRVLRFRLFQQTPRSNDVKTLKDALAQQKAAAAEKEATAAHGGLPKEKASIEKLDEKLGEILEEEVL